MSDQLPISIVFSEELLRTFLKLAGVCNKLEAQFNFHTMTAGWYGDENNIITIRFLLETSTDFSSYIEQNTQQPSSQILHRFADDVVCFEDKDALQLDCVIALTKAEHQLLTTKDHLLFSYLEVKLRKVLNLIAQQQGLIKI
ncbi:hypothetical protein ACOYR1_11005 [Thalassotalea piscium]